MARVVAYIPDLLFGSQVQGALRAAGHEVELVRDEEGVRGALPKGADVLVVDLTDESARRASLVEALVGEADLDGVRTLAFYSHVEADTRALAESTGFDLTVPRSRMAREGANLIVRLAGGAS
jgi:nucleoside-diphosphate-sugar epimerase